MGFRIRATMDGLDVYFQGILRSSTRDTIDFAWTTLPDEACVFGLKEAAVDTTLCLERGEVVAS